MKMLNCSVCKNKSAYVFGKIESTGIFCIYPSKFNEMNCDGLYIYFTQNKIPINLFHSDIICDDCIDKMLYNNILQIDHLNIWSEYYSPPDTQSICNIFNLDYCKYNPIFYEDRVLRHTETFGKVTCDFKQFEYPEISLYYFDSDEMIKDVYSRMKENPELFGKYSLQIINNLPPLNIIIKKWKKKNYELWKNIPEYYTEYLKKYQFTTDMYSIK